VHSLIPAPLTEGPIRTEWILLPSARLGGDVFGYHQLDARTFAIFLLDVSGHGTGAAMHAVSVTNILQQAVPGARHARSREGRDLLERHVPDEHARRVVPDPLVRRV
jgi:serine phosphatase RsbU (regulator of sigma subunit)